MSVTNSLVRIIRSRDVRGMSSKRLDDLGDFLRHNYRLRVDCRGCKRVAILDPIPLIETCQRKGWSRQVGAIEQRMKCSGCGSRDVRMGPAFGP